LEGEVHTGEYNPAGTWPEKYLGANFLIGLAKVKIQQNLKFLLSKIWGQCPFASLLATPLQLRAGFGSIWFNDNLGRWALN